MYIIFLAIIYMVNAMERMTAPVSFVFTIVAKILLCI